MNELKATPGPWSVEQSFEDAPHSVDAIDPSDGQGFELCAVWGENDSHLQTKMSQANAYLISAAPDLYAELKTAHDNLYALINDPEIGHEVLKFFDMEDVAAMARPLAKARGES